MSGSARTIAVEMTGGLGNQFFQYAAARALAMRWGTEPVFDVRPFEHDVHSTPWKFQLDRFKIKGRVATAADHALFGRGAYSKNRALRKIQRAIDRWTPGNGIVYREKHGAFVFDEDIFYLAPPALLVGYWQSEKYFKPIRSELLSELELRAPLSPAPQAILRDIRKSPRPVSVHVRRGDYVSNPKAARFHGQCSLRYYEEAMGKMRAQFPDAQFFIFSDDIAWCRDHIRAGSSPVTYVDADSPDKSLAELMLMKACSHHITANSSFSWWGAWLCVHAGQTVIAPRRWVVDPATMVKDVVPETWIRIEN